MTSSGNRDGGNSSAANIDSMATEASSNPIIETSHLRDPGWQHCTALTTDKKKTRCNYCGKEMFGGINRLKHHLAKLHGEAEICHKVPTDVSKSMKEHLSKKKEAKTVNQNKKRNWGDFTGKSTEESEEVEIVKSASRGNTDQKLTTFMDKGSRKRVVEIIGRWFFHSAIPFNAADSIYFPKLIETIAAHGPGLKVPTPYELSGPVLDGEVESLEIYMKELKETWPSTGCSILSDGWTDQRGKSIINFIVSCPRGSMFLKSVDASGIVKDAENLFNLLDGIVEEVGEENVVQVITDNAANYVAAGKLLMKKRTHLFWTSCAAHNIDLILEKIGQLKAPSNLIDKSRRVAKFIYNHGLVLHMMRQHTNNKEILRPNTTRFATNFILIGSLLEQRVGLKSMMLSEEWVTCRYANMTEGRECEKIILDNNFWRRLDKLQKSVIPLIELLRLVDGEKETMGLIYDAIDKTKLAIAAVHDNKEDNYKKYWDIIDNRWESTLHSPLHAAGYFLNPSLRFRPEFSQHPEVRQGLKKALLTLEPDNEKQIDMFQELNLYDASGGDFGTDIAIRSRTRLTPVAWWKTNGGDAPNLQRIAIRLLSQTYSATACERNWSTFDQIHTKKRNRLKQDKLNKLVFVHYNMRLRERHLRRHASDYDPSALDNALLEGCDDEWISSEPNPQGSQENPTSHASAGDSDSHV